MDADESNLLRNIQILNQLSNGNNINLEQLCKDVADNNVDHDSMSKKQKKDEIEANKLEFEKTFGFFFTIF